MRPGPASEGEGGLGSRVVGAAEARLDRATGGPARRRVVVLLAAVLGLDTADKAALSAVAGPLKDAFGIGNTKIGVLVSVVSLVGAALTLPMGVLIDRFSRTRLLYVSIILWTLAMIASGAATSFLFLLLARVFLGIVTAVAGPAVASLVGDYFPAVDRGRIYGMVLAGELIGLGIGFVIAGVVSDLASWRWAFWALAPLSALVGWALWRFLPEPARGGQSWLRTGAQHIRSKQDVEQGRHQQARADTDDADEPAASATAPEVVGDEVEPRPELVLSDDPRDRSLWWAMKYVLSIPTTRVLIVASALVYFYFAGIRAFAVVFVTGHFDISRSTATALAVVVGVGAVAGVVLAGRLSDRLVSKGRLNGRIVIVSVVLVAATVLFAPAVHTTSVLIAVPLLIGAGFFLAAANPPLDAARLDVMPPTLWGRAESIRQFLRGLAEAAAPTSFGFISEHVFSGGQGGLELTFLVMLVVLLLGAVVVLPALRSYPRDVATAAASATATQSTRRRPGPD